MFSGLLGLIHLVLVVWAVLNIAKTNEDNMTKALWIVLVLVFPFVGWLIWYFIGPKSS